jgi:methionyl-tRNA synthetase
MLMAAGIELPKQVFAHGWWRMGGEKMSKSDGNVVNPIDLIDEYGPDPVRYFVLREIPPGADGDFTMERFIDRFDLDLANDLGNLVHRSLSMLKKYNDAKIPSPGPAEGPDDELRELALGVLGKVRDSLEKRETNTALENIWEVIRRANKYIEESAPWTLNKEGRSDRLNTVLYNILEMIRISSVMLTPFLPQTGAKIIAKLGLDEKEAHAPFAEQIVWGRLQAGTQTELGDPLYPRIQQKTGGKK